MNENHSPFIEFPRNKWRLFRKDVPMTLSKKEVEKLRGQIEKISIEEVEEIYLPLSRLLNMYFANVKQLFEVTEQFLGHTKPKTPYIIGIAGSVAVGKSSISRILQALLSRWPEHRSVEIVTTDGFLYSNKILEERSLMNKKGFPESYNLPRLLAFLSELKSGKKKLQIPIYSHRIYDILPDSYQIIEQPDILILEGLNVLQIGPLNPTNIQQVFVSDFFDFSLYVDAETAIIKQWFLDRFALFRRKAKSDSQAFFHQFAQWKLSKAMQFAEHVWTTINEHNLKENILPYKHRARLILKKNASHEVETVFLRKL